MDSSSLQWYQHHKLFNRHHSSVSQSVVTPSTSSDVMNQLCRVCGEPAAGFHFGAFTCEGCKSFFGRTYNNLSSISECKNGGQCIINKKNRTSCKACRLRKCLVVGMSKSGSRYGRRSNWFKIHCLLQEQSNNNNNNTIQQTTIENSKLISSKNSDNSTSSWHSNKKQQTNESANISDYTSSENANAASLAAAAAFWAARIPQLPSPDPQVSISPFLASPFANRNFLFPYLSPVSGLKPSATSPSSSTTSSCCSSPKEKVAPKIFENKSPQIEPELTGLELLRALGPEQDKPMDLSIKSGEERSSSRTSSSSSAVTAATTAAAAAAATGDDEGKLEHPGKPPTPLDLTTKI